MMVSNRNLLFQGSMFRFHVCFGGCNVFIISFRFLKTGASRSPQGGHQRKLLGTQSPLESLQSGELPASCHMEQSSRSLSQM